MQGFWIYFFETPALTQLEIDYKLLKDIVFIVFQRALSTKTIVKGKVYAWIKKKLRKYVVKLMNANDSIDFVRKIK